MKAPLVQLILTVVLQKARVTALSFLEALASRGVDGVRTTAHANPCKEFLTKVNFNTKEVFVLVDQ